MNLIQRIKIAFSNKALEKELCKRVDFIVKPLQKEVESTLKEYFDSLSYNDSESIILNSLGEDLKIEYLTLNSLDRQIGTYCSEGTVKVIVNHYKVEDLQSIRTINDYIWKMGKEEEYIKRQLVLELSDYLVKNNLINFNTYKSSSSQNQYTNINLINVVATLKILNKI